MTTLTRNAETIPETFSAQAICHVSGHDVGQIRLECDLPKSVTPEETLEHLRIQLPGELSLLKPNAVEGEHGQYTVAFFSSDLANSGHLPADCTAIWQRGDETQAELSQVPVVTAVSQDVSDEATEDLSTAPGTAYPRTVVVAAGIALFVGAAVLAAVAIVANII